VDQSAMHPFSEIIHKVVYLNTSGGGLKLHQARRIK